MFYVKFVINNFILNSIRHEINSVFVKIIYSWIMRLILIIVNQMQLNAISGVEKYDASRDVICDIKLDKNISVIFFFFLFIVWWGYQRHSLFSQQTCRYNVMTFTATAGSREKSHLFPDDNKFSLSMSLIMSITLGGQIHITFPL